MSDKISVPPRSTVTLDSVNGDLSVGEHAILRGAGTPPTIHVSGTVYLEDGCVVEGNLSAEK